eukprot:g4288.t1 g4288   contig15:728301-729733(-)
MTTLQGAGDGTPCSTHQNRASSLVPCFHLQSYCLVLASFLEGLWSGTVGILGTNANLSASPKAQVAMLSTDPSFTSLRGEHSDSLKVAWLMSFPNSGTSYTSYLVRTVTGMNTASNYGLENQGEDGTSVPVFHETLSNPPFWTDPMNPQLTKPTRGYLLTKTHCGGRCDQCGPMKYVENHQLFLKHCLEGQYVARDESGNNKEYLGSYPKDKVSRAVHLIRDPFDNVVSRYHLAHKHFIRKNETDKMNKFTRTREGFRAFCNDLSERYTSEEKASKFYQDVYDIAKNVPCHADFFRFVQWHNLAFITTVDLQVPTMVVHYENYTDSYNQTKDMLLDFLDQPQINEPPTFVTGKTYREYFTDEEIKAVSAMFAKLAMDATWLHTNHYFD